MTRILVVDDHPADYQLPDRDGAILTWELKQLPEPPRVVICSACAEPRLSLQRHFLEPKPCSTKTARWTRSSRPSGPIAAGKSYVELVPLEAVRDGTRLIAVQDQSNFGLAVAGEQAAEIAGILQLEEHALRRRLRLMIQWLGPGQGGYAPFTAVS